MWDFWATIYYIYKNDLLKTYLLPNEEDELNRLNRSFNEENDTSIAIDDYYDWDEQNKALWVVRTATAIREDLGTSYNNVKIRNVMTRKGISYKQYKVDGKNVKGYLTPPVR